VLDRDTGKPVWPVEERAVPQGAVEGETLSPTQPFPTHVPPLSPQTFSLDDVLRYPIIGSPSCDALLAPARNDGLYTPPSTQGTLEFPFTGGGVNWGSAAFDPVRQILYANTTNLVHLIKLIPAADVKDYNPPPGEDFGRQRGAPFAMKRVAALSRGGAPCNKPPWGEMVALDLKAGVIFTGAMDAYLRAFDAASGRELWQGRLPVPGVANPMTYLWKGEQYVAIAAGGHSEAGTSIGDSVVAFRLPRAGEAPSLWSRTIDRPGGRFEARASAAGLVVVLMVAGLWRWRRSRRVRRAD
jgi:quinoprotein glucose dehydrogenase